MIYLVYLSSATRLLDSEEIDAILESSRRNNAALSITGMLLYWDGTFVQLLEGPEYAVRKVMAAVGRDRRHQGLVVVGEGPLDARHFDEWTMGFADPRELAARPAGFGRFLDDPRSVGLEDASRTYRFLLSFRDEMQRAAGETVIASARTRSLEALADETALG